MTYNDACFLSTLFYLVLGLLVNLTLFLSDWMVPFCIILCVGGGVDVGGVGCPLARCWLEMRHASAMVSSSQQ